MTPLVNILICNYNYENYIEKAIESALNQTYNLFDITIIDDKSTDSSIDIVNKFLSRKNAECLGIGNYKECSEHTYKIPNSKCRLIRLLQSHENSGPSKARNIGIRLTIPHTDIYAILDADDEMYPDKLELGVGYLMQSPQIGVVYGDYDILNVETGNVIREFKEPFSRKRLLEECIVHSGALIKKEALLDTQDEFGFYDENMRTCEDYDLWIRISEKYMIFHIPKPLTLVRVHKDNSTYTVKKTVWENNWRRIQQKCLMRQKQ